MLSTWLYFIISFIIAMHFLLLLLQNVCDYTSPSMLKTVELPLLFIPSTFGLSGIT